MNFYIIFFVIYFIHNSFGQTAPQVTGRNFNHQQRQIHSNNQENDLSINSIRHELNAFRLQLERIENSNIQVVNAVKSYRYEMDELKKSLNKVQGEICCWWLRKKKKSSMWWEEIFCYAVLKVFFKLKIEFFDCAEFC